MLVKALRLRRADLRITSEELRQEVPLVGRLHFDNHPNSLYAGKGAQMCMLMPVTGSSEPHVQSFRAKLRRIDKRGLIIQGVEERWRRKESTEFRQALWCWPIGSSELQSPPPHPLDDEDDAEALRLAMR